MLVDPQEVRDLEVLDREDSVPRRFRSDGNGGSIVYDVTDVDVTANTFLSLDMKLEAEYGSWFEIRCLPDRRELEDECVFSYFHSPGGDVPFGLIPGVEAQVRIPIGKMCDGEILDKHGAFVKPFSNQSNCFDESRTDWITLRPLRSNTDEVTWTQSAIRLGDEPPSERRQQPTGNEPVLDEFGQWNRRDWSGKVTSETDLGSGLRDRPDSPPLESRVDYRDAEGFFDTHYDGDRWRLLDPDGEEFWSVGINDVSPWIETDLSGYDRDVAKWVPDEDGLFADCRDGEVVNFLATNFVREFGPDDWREEWRDATSRWLSELNVNTIGAWSDWEWARNEGIPYVRNIEFDFPATGEVIDGFPDPFDPNFEDDAARTAAALEETVGDPAMVGYYVGNIPFFNVAPPAERMFLGDDSTHAHDAFASYLRDRYHTPGAFTKAWGRDVTFADVRNNDLRAPLPREALADVTEFSERLVDALYRRLSTECTRVDDDHLNLGTRYPSHFPDWLLPMAEHVDVLSLYCYQNEFADSRVRYLADRVDVPVMVAEYHFGANDVGLPFSGHCRVSSQAERGKAYQNFTEHAAAHPSCVGAHYFKYYDESAIGRFDGESFNTGVFDVVNRPYTEFASRMAESNGAARAIATGEREAEDRDVRFRERLIR